MSAVGEDPAKQVPDEIVSNLPAGWSSAVDPATGKTFYLNDIDKTTHWEPPPPPPPGSPPPAEQEALSPLHASVSEPRPLPAYVPPPPAAAATFEENEYNVQAFFASTAKPVLGGAPGTLGVKRTGLGCSMNVAEVEIMSVSLRQTAALASQIVATNQSASLLKDLSSSVEETKVEKGGSHYLPPLLSGELLTEDLGVRPMNQAVSDQLTILDQEQCLVLHLKTTERVSVHGIVQSALKEGELVVDKFDLCAIQRCPGQLIDLAECCALYVTSKDRLIFSQSVDGAEIELGHDPFCCDRWSLMRSNRSRRSYLGSINKSQIVSATVSQVDRTVFSQYSGGCFGCWPSCPCILDCFGGRLSSFKTVYQAITTLDERDMDTTMAWSKTQHQQHALIIRYLDLGTQAMEETVVLLQPGSPMQPLYRLCSELSSSFDMSMWLSKHRQIPTVSTFSRLSMDAAPSVTIGQLQMYYGFGFFIFVIVAATVPGFWLILSIPSIVALGLPLFASGSLGLVGTGGESGWGSTLGSQYWGRGYVKIAAAAMVLAIIVLIIES